MKVAVFGGTFDPPTLAHEAIVRACLGMPDFDQVWIMPSGSRTDKPHMSSAHQRLTLLNCMKQGTFANNSRLVISDFEIALPAQTETFLTVRALRQAYPQHQFWYVFGPDSYWSMPQWRGGRWLQTSLPLLMVPRYGIRRPRRTPTIRHLHLPRSLVRKDMSSTLVRHRVKEGLSLAGLVSPAVADGISRQKLYRTVQ